MSGLLIAVPVLPLLAIPLILGFGRRLPWHGGEGMVAATALVIAALLLLRGEAGTVQAIWFATGGLRLTAGLTLDGLTWFAAMIVAVISLFASVYSIGYMADEADRPRFFATLALFVGAMLTLVLASSLVLLFGAWEMVGLASYLLIGFRTQDGAARDAAAKAFLMTRIGDVGFLLAWLLVLAARRTTDIAALLAAASHGALPPGMLTLVALLLFLAVIGKSAQLPLTAWLPDAMAAPTPVSALLHSATMVAAGIYLLLRLYPLFAAAPGALPIVFWVGAATALVSALVATGEMDLKRLLAWSTSSQLGEMVLALGLGGPFAASLHFMMHATFKSTLFLSAGAIDKHTGTRDLRRLGGLRHVLPVAAFAFLVGALSLAGLQPTLGSTSDDAILATALAANPAAALLVIALIFLGGLYIGRAGTLAFLGSRLPGPAVSGGRWLPMRAGMITLAMAAALAGLTARALPHLLPFAATPDLGWAWRAGGLAVGIAGLAAGGWHARRHGPAPMLGRIPGALTRTLATATWAPAHAALGLAQGTARIETALDAGAHAVARGIWVLATGSDRLERDGFAAAADRLAQGTDAGGGWLQQIETGKLYLYTLGIVAWSLAVLLTGGIVLGF